jgi:hypothetical protein
MDAQANIRALQIGLQSGLKTDAKRLPSSLPLGFPKEFATRLTSLVQRTDVTGKAFQHLYFDLVLCPQLHASMRRMRPGFVGASSQARGEAIFLDPKFSWSAHINDRLGHRWRECLLRHADGDWLSEELALLSSFRVLAEHLTHLPLAA